VPQKIEGTVVEADREGNLRTDITAEILSDCPRGPEVTILCEGHSTNSIFPHDHEQQEMTYIAVLCADGVLMLSLVGDSAAKFLGIRSGDKVVVKW
jgi:S-adenosylmethionine hydrolase